MSSPVFSKQDLKLLGVKVFAYQLSLWQKQGYIIKVKNGIYVFADCLEKVSPEDIASLLYSPSYISLEKALSIYGLIPEMVYSITCITPKATRRFKNKFGGFIYRHIKPSLFFGYRQIKGKNISYLLAEPEKALLDFIYLNTSKIKNKHDLEGLRLNWKVLAGLISRDKLKQYLKLFKNQAMGKIVQMIMEKI